MSGGSLDYVYRTVEDISFREETPMRKAFALHLKKIAKALHDIEWVDSCDYSKGQEDAAILACISQESVLAVIVEDGKRVMSELQAALVAAAPKPEGAV